MSRLRNGDKPAAPIQRQTFTDTAGDHPMETTIIEQFGLTKREYFAGLAMQGLLSDNEWSNDPVDRVAGWAVKHADALLAALEPKS